MAAGCGFGKIASISDLERQRNAFTRNHFCGLTRCRPQVPPAWQTKKAPSRGADTATL
jgi:hypothetical protein